jgi:thioesterase III
MPENNENQEWLIHQYPFRVLEGHVDMFGHMSNIAYLEVFEAARWQMITERGYGADRIQTLRRGPVVLNIEVQFRKELRLRQEVVIETFGVSYPGKVGSLTQRMVSPKGDLHCQADFKMGLFDLDARKLVQPTPEWLHACGKKSDI